MLGKYILNYVVYGQNITSEGIFVFHLLHMYIKMFISYFIQRNSIQTTYLHEGHISKAHPKQLKSDYSMQESTFPKN
jgi:hypothetical protein